MCGAAGGSQAGISRWTPSRLCDQVRKECGGVGCAMGDASLLGGEDFLWISGVSMSRSCLCCCGEPEPPPGSLGFPSTEPFGHEFPSVSEEMMVVRFPGDTLHSSALHPPCAAVWDGAYGPWGWEDATAGRK